MEHHEQWLRELTVLPTAAGKEDRVFVWLEDWLAARPNFQTRCDVAGNFLVTRAGFEGDAPLYITAHLDHPAFVVREILDEQNIVLEFRGGVGNAYFENARLEIFDASDNSHVAQIIECDFAAKPFKQVTARLDETNRVLRPGDIGRWHFEENLPRVENGILRTHACDDLAGVAAALSTLDSLQDDESCVLVGVLLTRAEEVGFIGAYAACESGLIPQTARLICLENSRSFAESPIGGGPILRVGDKTSVFSPDLTNRIGLLMNEYEKERPEYFWQRKLMPGGSCEATVFAAFGYEATCLCLPLGNYHNMQDIDGVLAGESSARVGPEYISLADYHGLIEMLVLCATRLDAAATPSLQARLRQIYEDGKHVL